ncbi:hypothetical protein, conserved, partial [Eimeria acervulina]
MEIVKKGSTLTVTQSRFVNLQPDLPNESSGYGNLGDGRFMLPSSAQFMLDGDEEKQNPRILGKGTKQGKELSSGRRARVLWAALAATVSLLAIVFLVQQCSTALQAPHSSATFRRLAVASGDHPDLQICQEEVPEQAKEAARRIVARVKHWVDTSKNWKFDGAGGSRQVEQIAWASIKRRALTPTGKEHWIQVSVRFAKGREVRHASHANRKKGRLLMGPMLFKLKYCEIETADKLEEEWDRVETVIMESTDTGQRREVAVAAERCRPHGFEMGVVTIKVRCATSREVRLHRLERTHYEGANPNFVALVPFARKPAQSDGATKVCTNISFVSRATPDCIDVCCGEEKASDGPPLQGCYWHEIMAFQRWRGRSAGTFWNKCVWDGRFCR